MGAKRAKYDAGEPTGKLEISAFETIRAHPESLKDPKKFHVYDRAQLMREHFYVASYLDAYLEQQIQPEGEMRNDIVHLKGFAENLDEHTIDLERVAKALAKTFKVVAFDGDNISRGGSESFLKVIFMLLTQECFSDVKVIAFK